MSYLDPNNHVPNARHMRVFLQLYDFNNETGFSLVKSQKLNEEWYFSREGRITRLVKYYDNENIECFFTYDDHNRLIAMSGRDLTNKKNLIFCDKYCWDDKNRISSVYKWYPFARASIPYRDYKDYTLKTYTYTDNKVLITTDCSEFGIYHETTAYVDFMYHAGPWPPHLRNAIFIYNPPIFLHPNHIPADGFYKTKLENGREMLFQFNNRGHWIEHALCYTTDKSISLKRTRIIHYYDE
jgi:hypothetical protein